MKLFTMDTIGQYYYVILSIDKYQFDTNKIDIIVEDRRTKMVFNNKDSIY